ncbi:MAG: NUDIX domain-containing protein [archaeon]
MSEINWKNKCWVTTVFLVNKDKRVLLTWNKNLQAWIPVGGHIDIGETPMEAIRREVQEETGLEFDLYGDFKRELDGRIEVIKMHRFQIEAMPHHGSHMNFVFFGRALSELKKKETDEKEKLKWFSKKELLKEKILENVKSSALKALEVVKF